MHTSKFLTLLLLALLLAACGAPTATPSAEPPAEANTRATSVPVSTPPPPSSATAVSAPATVDVPTPVPAPTPEVVSIGTGPVKITWWHISTNPQESDNWKQLANDYIEQHANVSITITAFDGVTFKAKLEEALEAGHPPDIFQTWGGGVLKHYAEAGLVQDLTPALAENGWGKSFHAGPLLLYSFDGKTYGIPWDSGMVGFWYNKALFKQAGIEGPPATWSGLLDAVKKLKAAGITPIALGEKDKWPGHYYWAYLVMRTGGRAAFERAYSRKGSFADQPFVDAGARLKELTDLQPFQPAFLDASYADQMQLMADGKAAMELMGQWAPSNDRALAKEPDTFSNNLGFFPFPAVEGTVGDVFDILGGGNGFTVGKNAPKEAIDLVRFLTSLKVQTAMAQVGLAVPPVVKGAAVGLKDPLMEEIQRRTGQTQYYQLYYDQYLPPSVGQAVNDGVQTLFAGSVAPEQVAKIVEQAAAASLKP